MWWAIGIAVGVIVMGFLLFLYALFSVGKKADGQGGNNDHAEAI